MKRTDIPVVIGVAQLVEHESDPRIAMTPLEMLVRIGREASEDAGGGKRLINQIDTIGLVTVAGWYPRNAAALLGEKLGVRPATTITTEPGGETPLVLVNHVAAQIALLMSWELRRKNDCIGVAAQIPGKIPGS